MLIYANQMSFSGEGAEKAVVKSVRGWLKEQLGFILHPNQLKISGKYRGKGEQRRTHLEVYTAIEQPPNLYSWVLVTPDKCAHGRKWNVELGLKISGNVIEFSCVLETNERSALVAAPVMASKPRVMRYVIKNIRNSKNAHFDERLIGTSIKKIGEDDQFYHDLLLEIERTDRHYPLVLVSPNRNGKYLVNSDRLQDELVGLAQVIRVAPEFDSYKMTEILGKQWSAWDGAVNVIRTPRPTERIRSRYFLSEEIENWGNAQRDRVSRLLAWVTNDTNIAQRKNRIRPEDVRQAAFQRRIGIEVTHRRISKMRNEELRAELSKARNQIVDLNKYFEQLVAENHQIEENRSELMQQLKDAGDTNDEKDFLIKTLKDKLEDSGNTKSSDYDIEWLLELAYRTDQPRPEDCLKTIEMLLGDNCIVLDTAKKSAQDANTFKNGRRLLNILKRLVVEYRQALITGGDNCARTVFRRNEFAAKESETVMKNKYMKRARTFEYRGKNIEMFRHLKIGSADDKSHTIRVHFHWDSDRKKIVIGYCGKHLPISDN